MTDQEFTEENRRHWNRMADTYSSKPWQIKMQTQIFDELRSKHDFLGLSSVGGLRRSDSGTSERQIRLLDYACGTGLVSRALAPYITSATGVDISANMVSKFNETLSSATEFAIAHSVVVSDLFSDVPAPELSRPEFYNFDVAAVGLGFHHFASPETAVRRLVERLKPGTGTLLIVDWVLDEGDEKQAHKHDNSHRDAHHAHHNTHSHAADAAALKTIRTHGFTEEGMKALFEAAGLEKFGFSTMDEQVELVFDREEPVRRTKKTVFLARATRKA